MSKYAQQRAEGRKEQKSRETLVFQAKAFNALEEGRAHKVGVRQPNFFAGEAYKILKDMGRNMGQTL